MKEEAYLHINNGGYTFSVEDSGNGIEIHSSTNHFGAARSNLKLNTNKLGLLSVFSVVLTGLLHDGYSEEYCCSAKVSNGDTSIHIKNVAYDLRSIGMTKDKIKTFLLFCLGKDKSNQNEEIIDEIIKDVFTYRDKSINEEKIKLTDKPINIDKPIVCCSNCGEIELEPEQLEKNDQTDEN